MGSFPYTHSIGGVCSGVGCSLNEGHMRHYDTVPCALIWSKFSGFRLLTKTRIREQCSFFLVSRPLKSWISVVVVDWGVFVSCSPRVCNLMFPARIHPISHLLPFMPTSNYRLIDTFYLFRILRMVEVLHATTSPNLESLIFWKRLGFSS